MLGEPEGSTIFLRWECNVGACAVAKWIKSSCGGSLVLLFFEKNVVSGSKSGDGGRGVGTIWREANGVAISCSSEGATDRVVVVVVVVVVGDGRGAASSSRQKSCFTDSRASANSHGQWRSPSGRACRKSSST